VSSNGTSVVEVQGLRKVFGSGDNRVEALRGVNLRVAPGEFVAVMGPSGSGKSTLLHVLAGLDTPSAGSIWVSGADLGKLNDDQLSVMRRRRVGFVFQAFNLLDVLTAQENVALPLVVDGAPEVEANRRADAVLELVGLGQRRGHMPRQLSGGEQQRVAIARALVTRPPLLLADEPTGNLDSDSADQIMAVLRDLVRQGQTILMVTHDARHAAMAHRLLRLRDGRIIEEQILSRVRPLDQVLEDLEDQEALP
jgi:putative ABC transport system ATP-binding protein